MKRNIKLLIVLAATQLSFLTDSIGQEKINFAAGLVYRNEPIDIENTPRGGSTTYFAFYDYTFWQAPSLNLQAGQRFSKNWTAIFSTYIRYNHMNFTEGKNEDMPRKSQDEKKNFKYDLFLIAEKKLGKAMKDQGLLLSFGVGVTNLNSKYDVFIKDTLSGGIITAGRQYKGNIAHFGPQLSVGYKLKRVILSVEANLVEGVDRNDLTAIWLGARLNYTFKIYRKKHLPTQ